jgi:hypothetical protein
VFRRLNRSEYENTLCDLLDLPGLEVRDLLPEDGSAGTCSPRQDRVEYYLNVSRRG